jgi:hypothetical protein
MVEPDRPQMTILRMRISGCIPKATNTHSQYVKFIDFSTAATVTRTRLNVTLYVHWLSCVQNEQIVPQWLRYNTCYVVKYD